MRSPSTIFLISVVKNIKLFFGATTTSFKFIKAVKYARHNAYQPSHCLGLIKRRSIFWIGFDRNITTSSCKLYKIDNTRNSYPTHYVIKWWCTCILVGKIFLNYRSVVIKTYASLGLDNINTLKFEKVWASLLISTAERMVGVCLQNFKIKINEFFKLNCPISHANAESQNRFGL